ncbi:MAG: helicase C-terminal domain-containing protein [Candidatus Zixiibacteriota bacterium]
MPALDTKQFILWCDIKAPTPTARILSLEVFQIADDEARAIDVLVLPEEKSMASPDDAKIDKFFLSLHEGAGFKFINRDLYSNSVEWNRTSSYLGKTSLVDIAFLLRLFFPTLSANSLNEYERAFELPEGLKPHEALSHLVGILSQRVRELPGGTLRSLKTVFRGLASEYSNWLNDLPRSKPDSHYVIDPDRLNTLDRFENLTSGSRLSPDDALLLFSEAGKMSQHIKGYELRKGQAKYAQAVLKSIQQHATLLLEAATGTGKSLGYLLPTIASSAASENRAIIVTRTKSLQEQLFRSDLRKIRALIPDGYRVSLLKGLNNYLCLLKYKLFLSELSEHMGRIPAEHMAALIVWESSTESGDLTETAIFDQQDSEELLPKVTLEEGACLRKECQFYNDCYAFRARKSAAHSNLVITNYALLFADLVSGSDILGRFSHAIFDEAHRLEYEAINAFSETLPLLAFARSLERLSEEKTAATLKAALESNDNPEILIGFDELSSRLHSGVILAAESVRQMLKQAVRTQQERVRFRSNDPIHDELCDLWTNERESFMQLREALADCQQALTPKADEEKIEGVTQLKRQCNALIRYITMLERLPESTDTSEVMWAHLQNSGEVWITIAPLNVGELLSRRLYDKFDSIVFTSATLDSEDNFEWTASRLGLTDENARSVYKVKIRSPFPLQEQLRIALARYLPPPNMPEYGARLSQLILKLRSSARLPTLALCTSYRMVEELAKPLLAAHGQVGEVLYQTPDTLPQTLLNRFKLARNAILIGTESFWEGIDLPDELLRLLFITRLPFAVPDDPLELARQEQAELKGENPFMSISLPQAVLKYRQGVGRMIRSGGDWGAVIITDSRMGRKNYGKILFAASPVEISVYDNEPLLVNETAKWLSGKREGK